MSSLGLTFDFKALQAFLWLHEVPECYFNYRRFREFPRFACKALKSNCVCTIYATFHWLDATAGDAWLVFYWTCKRLSGCLHQWRANFFLQTSLSTVPLPNTVFYTTRTFDLKQQIESVQSTEGFLGDTIGDGAAVEDPLWGGTRAVGGKAGYIDLPSGSGNKRQVPEGGDFQGVPLFLHSDVLIMFPLC